MVRKISFRSVRSRHFLSAVSLVVGGCLLNPQPDEPNNAENGNEGSGGASYSSSTSTGAEQPKGGGTSNSGISIGSGGRQISDEAPSAAAGKFAGVAGMAGMGADATITDELAGAAGRGP